MFTAPDAERVTIACETFDREFSDVEDALKELVRQFPRNDDIRHVLLKVCAINAFYSTQIPTYSERTPNLVDVAHHIQQGAREIDLALSNGSPDVVEHVALVRVREQQRNFFSFATKYCSWHQPHLYPIWDSNVERYLRTLQKKSGFAKDFDMNAHWKYSAFREVMNSFRERYGLSSFTFKDIDKFLWLHGNAEALRA